MLRFKILASAVPLILAGIFARNELVPASQPCISVGETSVQIAAGPWNAQLHVSFTNDPMAATARVQIVDSPDAADFVVVDDAATSDVNSCEVTATTRFIAITAMPSASAPVIYLSQADGADYRIYVRSKTFTARDAAALVIGANGGHPRLAAASL
jgi:hypothetical protein